MAMPASDLQLLADNGVRIALQVLAAVLVGGLLGYERQRLSKPVGLLTSILVSLGATIIVVAGALLAGGGSGSGDPTRMPSMIVSGIGFIGAGAIIRSKFKVSGLASAATIWVLGALGILIGAGHPLTALIGALTVFLLLRMVPKLEHVLFRQRFCLHASIAVEAGRANSVLEFLAQNQVGVARTRARADGDRVILAINECGVEHRGEFFDALRGFDGVVDVVESSG